MGEPWHLTLDEVARLDRYKVNHVYFRRRDKDGNLVIRPKSKAPPPDDREVFFRHWRRHSTLAEREIEGLWREAGRGK